MVEKWREIMKGARHPLANVFFRTAAVVLPEGREEGGKQGRKEGEILRFFQEQ